MFSALTSNAGPCPFCFRAANPRFSKADHIIVPRTTRAHKTLKYDVQGNGDKDDRTNGFHMEGNFCDVLFLIRSELVSGTFETVVNSYDEATYNFYNGMEFRSEGNIAEPLQKTIRQMRN